jgi:hypothetical protein
MPSFAGRLGGMGGAGPSPAGPLLKKLQKLLGFLHANCYHKWLKDEGSS